jgi:hypothetical protein
MNNFIEKLEKMTTDALFNMLPVYIIYDNDMYYSKICRGEKGAYIEYQNKQKKALFDTYRRENTLREVLMKYLELLNRYNLLKKPNNYFVEMLKIAEIQKNINDKSR